MERLGVQASELSVTAEFISSLCKHYACEPGIRDLEQCAERLIGDYMLQAELVGEKAKCYSDADLIHLFGDPHVETHSVIACPGMVKMAYVVDGQPHISLVQASIRPGTGIFQAIGAPSEYLKDCCHIAYECARTGSSSTFSTLDVTVCFPTSIPSVSYNFVGCAVFMAIMSAVTSQQVPETAVFFGGCDLFGNIIGNAADVGPITEQMAFGGEAQLYGPTNMIGTLKVPHSVQVVGSYNTAFLFEMLS